MPTPSEITRALLSHPRSDELLELHYHRILLEMDGVDPDSGEYRRGTEVADAIVSFRALEHVILRDTFGEYVAGRLLDDAHSP